MEPCPRDLLVIQLTKKPLKIKYNFLDELVPQFENSGCVAVFTDKPNLEKILQVVSKCPKVIFILCAGLSSTDDHPPNVFPFQMATNWPVEALPQYPKAFVRVRFE